MASTFSPNLNLELQGTGDNSGTWGSILNTAVLTVIDTVLGGAQTFSLSNVNVTVTTTQSQNNAFLLTGTLTGNVIITFPAIGRTIFVANNTTGNFSVTLARSGGGTTQTIRSGANGFFILTSSGVTAQVISEVPTGGVMAFAMTAVPTGWLSCNGQAVSRTTYADLYNTIGTTWGVGDGSTSFNVPDLRGYFLRGWDNSAGVDPGRAFASTQTSQNLSHTHTGTAADHAHLVQAGGGSRRGADGGNVGVGWFGSSGNVTDGGVAQVTSYGSGALALSVTADGGAEARPVNKAVAYCIRT